MCLKVIRGEIEALRCSGSPGKLRFRSHQRSTCNADVVSPSSHVGTSLRNDQNPHHLARGFDWAAHYTAVISPDGKFMDLGGWATLANANLVSFPESQTQVVAGRVNRDNGDIEPVDWGRGVVADCWPVGSTSDSPEHRRIDRAEPIWDGPAQYTLEFADVVVYAQRINRQYEMPMASTPISALSAPAVLMKEEALGDLKLYRVPQRTSVNSRQASRLGCWIASMFRSSTITAGIFKTAMTSRPPHSGTFYAPATTKPINSACRSPPGCSALLWNTRRSAPVDGRDDLPCGIPRPQRRTGSSIWVMPPTSGSLRQASMGKGGLT